jgi:glycosyltransferase involved in cell wall biosynthesis
MTPLHNPTVFVVLSFEGPDPYARAGGLGARVTELTESLADSGYETHLFFIGDPAFPGHELRQNGLLNLHRWCQWISRYYPGGTYDGEEGKLNDWSDSLVPWLADNVIAPAIDNGSRVVVLGEEWQTARSLIELGQITADCAWTDHVRLVWNANHYFGFDRIPWEQLREVATITTVSRYMRRILEQNGVEARVVPNGIGADWFLPVAAASRQRIVRSLEGRLRLVKVARWDPDKNWLAAVDTTAELKRRNQTPLLIARGGQGPHGNEVVDRARALGLRVASIPRFDPTPAALIDALAYAAENSDVVLLEPFLTLDQRKLLYQCADAVLANSLVEPFGLVGLETMAAGGIAFVGSTGEDYATPGHDAMSIETTDPEEIVEKILQVHVATDEALALRRAARQAARRYVWPTVLGRQLLPLVKHAAAVGGRPRGLPDLAA